MFIYIAFAVSMGVAAVFLVAWLAGVRYIPHSRVGIVEKLWSGRGSLTQGRIVALNDEAGFQASLLRGGLHLGFFPWQYRIHKEPLVMISESKIGYIYAREAARFRQLKPSVAWWTAISFRTQRRFCKAMASAEDSGRFCAKGSSPSIWRCLRVTEDRVFGPIREGAEEIASGKTTRRDSRLNRWWPPMAAAGSGVPNCDRRCGPDDDTH
jgi:hypothetical protein